MLKIKNIKTGDTFTEIISGVVYIPSVRTTYFHEDPFLELQLEVDKYNGQN